MRIETPWAWVEVMQTSACQSCSAKAGCGQSALGSIFSGKRHLVKVAAQEFQGKLKIGDEVELGIDEHTMLRSSLMVYMLPLFSMILAALAGDYFFTFIEGDLPALLGAALGFVGACIVLRAFSQANAENPRFQPVLQRILYSPAPESIETVNIA